MIEPRPETDAGGNGPVYLRICEHLRRQVADRQVKAGEFLPTDEALARSFGVSVGTIKKAMGVLQAEKMVRRHQGRGTQVCATAGAGSSDGRADRGGKILVLMNDVRRSFAAEVYKGIQSELVRGHYEPVLWETGDDSRRERDLLEKHAGSAAGVIIAPCSGGENAQTYRQWFGRQCPAVFVDRMAEESAHDAVVSDNERGGRLAVRYLLELGHRKIVFLGGGHANSVLDRFAGGRRAVEEWGLDPDQVLIRSTGGRGFDGAYEFIGSYLASHTDLTAAFCPRDDAAWGCIQRLSELGVAVPGRFSVIGYDDDDDVCSRIRPRLTTVRQAKAQMGQMAARRLIWRLEHPQAPVEPEVSVLPVELVVRESTGPVMRPATATDRPVPQVGSTAPPEPIRTTRSQRVAGLRG